MHPKELDISLDEIQLITLIASPQYPTSVLDTRWWSYRGRRGPVEHLFPHTSGQRLLRPLGRSSIEIARPEQLDGDLGCERVWTDDKVL